MYAILKANRELIQSIECKYTLTVTVPKKQILREEEWVEKPEFIRFKVIYPDGKTIERIWNNEIVKELSSESSNTKHLPQGLISASSKAEFNRINSDLWISALFSSSKSPYDPIYQLLKKT